MADNAYEDAVLADNATLCLPMDEASGNLTDIVGAKTATANGTPTYSVTGPVTGKTAIQLTAAGDYFTVADHADLDLGDGPFSIEVWFARDADTATFQGILNKGVNGYAVAIDAAGAAGFTDLLIGGKRDVSIEVFSDSTIPTDSTWHHYVWTRDGGAADLLYVDGVEAGFDNASGQAVEDTASVLEIGRETVSYRCAGRIAYIALYKTALSAGRVLVHYNAATAVDGAVPVLLLGGL